VCWWFGSTKTICFSEKPESLSHPDAAVCPIKFHCRKLFKNPCFGKLVCSHHQFWCCYEHVI
jgi:hypothetical protein